MTRLLASVRDAAEAGVALRAGFDGVVLPAAAADVADAPLLGRFDAADSATMTLREGQDKRRLAVLTAPWPEQPPRAATDAGGLLLHAAERLLDAGPFSRLAALVAAAQAQGLWVALGGALEPPDVPRVLALRPAALIVGRAIRAGGRSDAGLDRDRLAAMRAVVAPEDADAPAREVTTPRPDRIFLRDLVLTLDVGAYASEAGRGQRVGFSVEAELAATGRPSEAMADVVSYDILADAVQAVAASRRFAFVETMAEEIAARLMAIGRIVGVTVRVEKLDLGAGAVGIEIVRRVAAGG